MGYLGLLIASTGAMASYWQPNHGYIPHNAFMAGHEGNGRILYLCRAHFKGSTQIGKTWRGYHFCNISYAGREILLPNYSVYIRRALHGHWRHGNYNIPSNALRGGTDTNGKPLFVCKTRFHNSVQPGKTWPGYHKCNFSYAGREILHSHYKIFVTDRGRHFAPRPSVYVHG